MCRELSCDSFHEMLMTKLPYLCLFGIIEQEKLNRKSVDVIRVTL